MSDQRRIYLDNAATSWPKPESVYRAVDDYLRRVGAAAGRGSYRQAVEAGRIIGACRRAVAALIGAAEPERIILTANGTDSLNLALHGLLAEGDHVVTTVAEHNSVLRPLRAWEARGATVDRVPCGADGIVDPDAIGRALKARRTRLVAVVHASNVTGAIQPIEAIVAAAHAAGALVLVDAAQSLGHLPIDVRACPLDLLAAPGHKALLGPLGTGVLYIAPGIERQVAAVRQGGTGTQSESDLQPDTLPEKYESGNLNVAGVAGLAAGVEFISHAGVEQLAVEARRLTARLLEGLAEIEGVTVYGPADAARRVGVVSLNLEGYDPQELAALLDTAFGVQARSGLHCAPRMHAALGTQSRGGTLRLSMGALTTDDEVDAALAALGAIAAAELAG